MEGGTTHELHVEVTLAEDPLARLADDREGLDQQVVEARTLVEPLAELAGLGLELLVGEPLHLGLERGDVGHQGLQRLDLLALAGAEETIENSHVGYESNGGPGAPAVGRRPGPWVRPGA